MSARCRATVVAAAVSAIALSGATVALAAWSGAVHTGQGVSTGSFTAPADTAVTAAAGSSRITVSWKASTFSGQRPLSYVVQRHASTATAPSATAPVACTVPAAAVALGATRTCDDTTGTAGTSYRYSVRPVISSWSGPTHGLSSGATFPAAATVPTATVTVRNQTYTNNSQWSGNGCAADTACGTVSDGAGKPTSFSVQLTRTFEGATTYWTGSAWQSTAISVLTSVPSGTAWSFPITHLNLEAGTLNGSTLAEHTLTVRAANSSGTMTDVSGAFTTK